MMPLHYLVNPSCVFLVLNRSELKVVLLQPLDMLQGTPVRHSSTQAGHSVQSSFEIQVWVKFVQINFISLSDKMGMTFW